jgi:ABC-type transport system involved in multi-copper enzyme maturation permease subunit
MKTVRILYHMARADFLERARRTSFLFAVALGIYLGYSVNAGQIGIVMGDYRGIYNSAWVGTMMALVVNGILSLAGFYIVKNAIQRDTESGVGQIMATTPLTRLQYVLGKWLSNLVVLSALVLVLALAAVVLQLTQREAPELDLLALWVPMIVLTPPMMALAAAGAVLFETISWLRGGLGNIVYFFVWAFGVTIMRFVEGNSKVTEPMGTGLVFHSMSAALTAAYPSYNGTDFILGWGGRNRRLLATFEWNGVDWTANAVLGQLLWVGVALLIVALAALFFDRFDPSRERTRRVRKAPPPVDPVMAEAPAALTPVLAPHVLSPVTFGRTRFGAVWLAELRLLLKGQRWWWFAVAGGLIVAGLFSSAQVARQYILPFAWIWPVLIWSQLGNREAAHRTSQMVFSAPRAVWRQLPAAWLAGVTLAALTGCGVLVTLLRFGDTFGLAAWGAGALFVPALALCSGVISGGSKLFEIIFLLMWYIGPLNRTPSLDFTGSTGQSQPLGFFGWAVGLVVMALLARHRHVQGC